MSKHRVVIFDGVCNFCNGTVMFIIKRDPEHKFLFVPMQNRAAQKLLRKFQLPEVGLDTFLLIEGDEYRVRTDAALTIAAELTWPWPLCKVFRIVPARFRDIFYKLFARNRYSLFGKRDVCMVPTSDIRSRFLDDM